MVFFTSEFVKLWSHLRIATTHGTDRLCAGDVVGLYEDKTTVPGGRWNLQYFLWYGVLLRKKCGWPFFRGFPGPDSKKSLQ